MTTPRPVRTGVRDRVRTGVRNGVRIAISGTQRQGACSLASGSSCFADFYTPAGGKP
jgi:hypothetical protein